jgi:hypothetical protein
MSSLSRSCFLVLRCCTMSVRHHRTKKKQRTIVSHFLYRIMIFFIHFATKEQVESGRERSNPLLNKLTNTKNAISRRGSLRGRGEVVRRTRWPEILLAPRSGTRTATRTRRRPHEIASHPFYSIYTGTPKILAPRPPSPLPVRL